MNPLMLNKTTTTKFILPMVFNKHVNYKNILTEDFVDTYVADFDKPEWDDHVLIVYHNHFGADVLKCEFALENTVADTYTFEEDLIIVCRISEGMEENYYNVIAGNYSELTEEYKQHILNFWKQDKDSELRAVLYNDKKRFKNKEHELEHGINIYRLKDLFPAPNPSDQIYHIGVE